MTRRRAYAGLSRRDRARDAAAWAQWAAELEPVLDGIEQDAAAVDPAATAKPTTEEESHEY